jgi:imidazolonepropionase-like amidohydrolase
MLARLTVAAGLALLASGSDMRAQSSIPVSRTLLVRDIRVFDGQAAADHRSVLVEHGVISRVAGWDLAAPTGADVVDGRGLTLLPGLIDAHVHVTDNADADLHQAVSLGVTTVLDMFSAGDRLERIKALRGSTRADIADVRTAGVGASVAGGHPSIMGGPPFPTLASAEQADAFVAARQAEGSDYIKIIYDDLAVAGMSLPMIDRRTLAAVIAAAHARGKKVVVHVMSETHALDAIDAGADGLAHLFVGATVSRDFARRVSDHHAFVIPTLGVLHGICGQPNGPAILADPLLGPFIGRDYRPMMSMSLVTKGRTNSCTGTDEAMRQLAMRHVPILAGTDAPTPTQTFGASLHGELATLVAAGLSPTDALMSATSAPAAAFALGDRGRIRAGFRADLVLVDGDPTNDITATRRIRGIWKAGVAVPRMTR